MYLRLGVLINLVMSDGARTNHLKKSLKASLGRYQDFPCPGILFEDICPIFKDPKLFQMLLDALKDRVSQLPEKPTTIVGLDARGFLFGPSLALQLGISFVPVRKKGKLPGEVYEVTFEKEYGKDVFVIQKSAIDPGSRVIIVDDIIATGGSAAAAGKLVEMAGGRVVEFMFLMELLFLKGREKLNSPVFTLLDGQA